MYCDYIFIKARRALHELYCHEAWEALRKQATRCTAELPKGLEQGAPEELDYPVRFVDYMDCILVPNPQPLTNPDQLIEWKHKEQKND